MPQPNLSLRINEQTPYSLLKQTAKTIRLGNGLPQVFNDEANILAYVNRGVDLHDARDYAVVGCVELSIPSKTYGLHDIAMFNLLKCMEVTMNEKKDLQLMKNWWQPSNKISQKISNSWSKEAILVTLLIANVLRLHSYPLSFKEPWKKDWILPQEEQNITSLVFKGLDALT